MKTEGCKKQVNFKLTPEVLQRLSEMAKETGRTKTRVVELALIDYLAKKEEFKP